MLGYVFAVATPVLFGLAFVLRKCGLRSFDSTVLGVLSGATTGLAFLTIGDLIQGRFRTRFTENFHNINWWFVAAGAAFSFALISQFRALTLVPAWVYAVFQSTQLLWVIALSYVFLKSEEQIDTTLIASTAGVAASVVLIAVSL